MVDDSAVVDEEDIHESVAVEVTVVTGTDVADAEDVEETEPVPDEADPGDGVHEDGEDT